MGRITMPETSSRCIAARVWLAAVVIFGLLLPLGGRALAAPQATDTPSEPQKPTPGQVALAERLAEMGQNVLRAPTITEASWMQSAALLQAACRLNPDEPRFPRLLADALLQLHDIDGAIDALNGYRDILRRKKLPDSPAVQARVIDLYLSRMETADRKLKYLQRISDDQRLAPEVRSHALTRTAETYLERSQSDKALEAIGQALELNSVNMAALRLNAQVRYASSSPAERTTLMLALLRGNPAQASVVIDLARELAAAGLSADSLYWYGLGLQLTTASQMPPSSDMVVGYVSELLLANERASAADLARQWLQSSPDDIDVRFLQMAIEKNALRQENYASARLAAHNALTNVLATLRKEAGDQTATTQPIDSAQPAPPGDPKADLELIRKSDDPRLLERYVTALADLAWLELYFNDSAQAADPLIAGIASVLTDESPTVARLQGWSFLRSGKLDEARVKLSAVADRDPLSRLGLVNVARKQKAADATEQARQLRQDFASGLVGVFVWDSLQDMGIRVEPDPAVEAELAKFPRDWMDILERPDLVYLIRGEPLSVSHAFGQPMLARVAVQNVSSYPISVGSDGALRADLWIDANLRGIAAQNIQGIAYDRLADPIVLKPGQTVEQIVRVDQGDFARMLNTNPTVSIQAFITVMTNPTTSAKGMVPGPGGQLLQLPRIVERKGTPITQDYGKAQTYQALSNGTPAEKLSATDLLGVIVRLIQAGQANQANGDQGAAAAPANPAGAGDQGEGAVDNDRLSIEFIEKIRQAANDSDENVQAWASYVLASVSDPEVSIPLVRNMMAPSSPWQKRLLSIPAMGRLPMDEQKDAVTRLAEQDPEPIVRRFASAAVKRLGAGANGASENTAAPVAPTTLPAIDAPPPAPAPPADAPAPAPAE